MGYTLYMPSISQVFVPWQVKDAELRLRHKLFPPNAWMKLTDFNVLASCPKDELHRWFLGLYGEHIIPAMVSEVPRHFRHGSPLHPGVANWVCGIPLFEP